MNNVKYKKLGLVNSFKKMMTKWVTSNNNEPFFCKTPVNNTNIITCGDISPLKKSVNWLSKIHFTINVGRETTAFDNHFTSGSNALRCMWEDAVLNADKVNKTPFLIYKNPQIATYVFVTYEVYNCIKREMISSNMINLRYGDLPATYVFEMSDFFSKIKYKKLRQIVKTL